MSKQPGASPQDCDWSQTSAEGATQGAQMNRAFSAVGLAWHEFLGRCPRLRMNAAPLALNTCPNVMGKAWAPLQTAVLLLNASRGGTKGGVDYSGKRWPRLLAQQSSRTERSQSRGRRRSDCVKRGTDPDFFWRICRLLSVFPRHTVTATVINLIVT